METPLFFDHYEVQRNADGSLHELGRGAMGVTYKATDTKLRIDVVLKLIHPELLRQERVLKLFVREARAAAKLRHPNIAAVISLHDEEPFYYTMEFVNGSTLSALLKQRGGTLPIPEALEYCDQVAAALGVMAREHIVHRDLKPANLMLVPEDEHPFGHRVKVIDFGLAKGFRIEGENLDSYLDSSRSLSVFTGTPYYASPEQCATSGDLDTRSDLYSLGIVLWEMLCGQRPFVGQLGQVLAMHQFKELPWEQLVNVPQPVLDLLGAMLAKERAQRIQTPRELSDAITRCSTQLGISFDRNRKAESSDSGTRSTVVTVEEPATQTIRLGTTLAERFRLGEQMGEGDGGQLFMAADNADEGALVGLKLLHRTRLADVDLMGRLTREVEALRILKSAVMLRPVLGLTYSGNTAFFVREWADGFSLLDLLKHRGQLLQEEVFVLLAGLPEAIDQAKAKRLTLAEPLLRKLFVTPPLQPSSDEWLRLRDQPVMDWPEYSLRWNATSFSPAIDEDDTLMTRAREYTVDAAADPVMALALLVRELLGGRPRALTPLPALSDEANHVLKKALEARNGASPYPTAAAFWDALRSRDRSSRAAPPARPEPRPVRAPDSTLVSLPSAPQGSAQPPRVETPAPSVMLPAGESEHSESPGRRRLMMIAAAAVVVLASAFAVSALFRNSRPNPDDSGSTEIPKAVAGDSPASEPAAPRPPKSADVESRDAVPVSSSPAVDSPAPSRAALPAGQGESTLTRAMRDQGEYVNSLGMRLRFVPQTGVLFGVWVTRQRDFAEFARAVGFAPKGGMLTLPKSDETTLAVAEVKPELDVKASWSNPGFPTGSDDPVVGVSWDDAKAFCRWLTTREREAGRIRERDAYRLPTDEEWTQVAGDRKYPWGDVWPPPPTAGNYLDKAFVEALPQFRVQPVPMNDGQVFLSPVGRYKPNAFALYDLGGNVWEWCEDEYRARMNTADVFSSYPDYARDTDSEGRRFRVLRGGSWITNDYITLRTAFRGRKLPGVRACHIGFRVVLAPEPPRR